MIQNQNDDNSDNCCEFEEVITTYQTSWLFTTIHEAAKEACAVIRNVLKLDFKDIIDFSVISTYDDNRVLMYELRLITPPEIAENLLEYYEYE